jgi:hypothetical protein
MQMCATPERIPVIHIGMPKTATKTLQCQLFSAHSEIFYLGRFDGPYFQGKYRQFDCCRDASVQTLMGQIAYGDVYSADFTECRKLLEQIIAPALAKNLLPVWSWESYSTDILAKRRVRARNLKQVFKEARIIITLRNPISLLESAYFQQLKRDNVGARGKFGRPPYYQLIDDWLHHNFDGEILPHLQYAETIQAYVDQFGFENIHVFLFEDLMADQLHFFRQICDVMGIGAEEGIRLVRGKIDNIRWSTKQIEALAEIVGSRMKSIVFRFASKKTRRELLGLGMGGIPVAAGEKARARISPEWQKKIFRTTRQGNLWLQEFYGLPLEKHGYFSTQEQA